MKQQKYTILNVPDAIKQFFAYHSRVALAFSGGSDSAYLLACAHVCKVNIVSYLVVSEFQHDFEYRDAYLVAKQIGEPIEEITIDIWADQKIIQNNSDRCYWCKKRILEEIIFRAQKDYGITTVIDGTNASDSPVTRPGFKALQELEILSPLRIAGLNKDMIRQESLKMDLLTSQKPSFSCRATQIPFGSKITKEKLNNVLSKDWK